MNPIAPPLFSNHKLSSIDLDDENFKTISFPCYLHIAKVAPCYQDPRVLLWGNHNVLTDKRRQWLPK